jgi:hypothetical protein
LPRIAHLFEILKKHDGFDAIESALTTARPVGFFGFFLHRQQPFFAVELKSITKSA